MRRFAILLGVTGIAVLAQDSHPAFEVASVKPSPPRTPMMVGATGGPGSKDPERYAAQNFDLGGLVQVAYGITRYQLAAPVWLNDLRFDVEAKVPRGTTTEEFRLMMQGLLRERFKMVAHHETREMQGYELVVYKNGPKIKESTEPFPKDPGVGASSKPAVDPDGFPVLPPGRFPWWTSGPNGRERRRVANMSMEEFARDLSMQLQGPVTDVTGLKGKYDFTMSWVFDTSPADAGGPDLFGAIQQQLGLKLDRKKEPVDVIVVDHIEKTPSEN
jgi:uncharacterized protein (TIGR03435 family)